MMRASARMLRASALPLAVALAACSGGGGGGGISSAPPPPPPAPTPTPVPTPTPAPAPAPTPTPGSSFDTAELQRSNAVTSSRAITAYTRGATGQGITVGVIDSGIDATSFEFAGRISAASADVAGTRGLGDDDGHGTAVAAVIAANKNDSGPHGVAFNSTLLIARTDTPGSCTNTNAPIEEQGCSHPDNAIARGIDLAVANNARVINISLGGSPANPTLRASIDRATAAGALLVFSAGNNGEEPDGGNPDPLAAIATEATVARGQIIIAGAHNGDETFSGFSNRAGSGQAFFLTALGQRVRTFDEDGTALLYTGTSFSAPVIAGAAALLAQAFPNLTASQLVQLLFSSARDLGAPGDDPVYGQGVLDIARAFQPIGSLSLAGSKIAVFESVNATTSPAMGDAASKRGTLDAVVLDDFDRAFALDLGSTTRVASPRPGLASALRPGGRHLGAASATTSISVSVAGKGIGEPLRLTPGEARAARATAGVVASRIDSRTRIALGFSTGAGGIAASLKGSSEPAFLVAENPNRAPGFERAPGQAFALRREIGRLGVTASAETGEALLFERDGARGQRGLDSRYGYASQALGLDRRFGALALGLEATRLAERETVLGARFNPALGGGGSASWFVDVDASLDAGRSWSLGATLRQGWTRARAGGSLTEGGSLRSNAFAFDAAKVGLLRPSDRFALRFAQPLRVESGGFDLSLPNAYDYATLTTTFATRRLNLAPVGRELDLEAAYGLPLWRGWLATNAFYRREPGNLAYAPTEIGAAVRFNMAF